MILNIPKGKCILTENRFTCSCRAPPNNAKSTGDSWSPLLAPLQTTSSSDLFSSLVSLDKDDRCELMIPSPKSLSLIRNCLLTRMISRPVLSQEFVGNLGILGDMSMDPIEFQNLFTA